jgi:hypothetical protein
MYINTYTETYDYVCTSILYHIETYDYLCISILYHIETYAYVYLFFDQDEAKALRMAERGKAIRGI